MKIMRVKQPDGSIVDIPIGVESANSAVLEHNADTSAHADIRKQIEKAVLYDEQTLTTEEKTQARDNIGAAVDVEPVNSIEECTDTSKHYVLPDGYIYAYTRHESKNHILSSINSDGTPYNNGTGYKAGSRLDSSGPEVSCSSAVVSGFIPYNGGTIELRIPNTEIKSFSSQYNHLHLYDSSFTVIRRDHNGNTIDGSYHQLYTWVENYGATLVKEDSTIKISFPAEILAISGAAYVRVSARVASSTTLNSSTFDLAIGEDIDGVSYSWSNTGLYYGTSYTENRLEALESTTSGHESRLNALEASSGNNVADNIPDYVVEEAEATIAKVFTHGNLGRTIRFIAISDTHEDSAESYNPQITISNQHAGQAIKYISDRIGLDFVAHLGDASSSGAFVVENYFDDLLNDVKNINKFIFSGVKGIKNVFIPGNHDQFYCTDGKRLFNSGAYSLFGSLCAGYKDRVGGYGYFDIEDAKVRVVYLNTSDIPNSTVAGTYIGFTQEQKNWLCETLISTNTKDDADEWGILLLSHTPLDFGNMGISSDILLAYVNGETYNSYLFTNNNARIISNIHGHVHCYSYGYLEDKIRRFTIPNACFVGANHYGSREGYEKWVDTETYHKTANSGKDTAFSLVTIDLDSGKCYVDNYGAGIDRVFSTDYKPEVEVVPTSISNISYNGDTTVGATIDKSKFTFAVDYSNGTTSTVTGATSVNPVTIGVVGNNTVTITYTEGGVSVTGTIIVVGTEAPVANLLNLNRTYMAGTAGESLGYSSLNSDTAYTNVVQGTNAFGASACIVSGISEDGVTVKEAGIGGMSVVYPVYLPNIGTKSYTLSFDYTGDGSSRVWYKYATAAGVIDQNVNVVNKTGSGHIDCTIPANSGFSWIVLFVGANTGKTTTLSNVSLTEV